jgi:hypothetical protein
MRRKKLIFTANIRRINQIFTANNKESVICIEFTTEIFGYFSNFEIEFIHEVKEDKISTLGEEVFFHNIDVVGRKKSKSIV